MADDLTFGIRITANGDQLVGAVKESAVAMDGLSTATQKAATSQAALEQASREYWDKQNKGSQATKDYMLRVEESAAAHKKAAEQIYVVNDAYIKNAEAAGKGTEHVKTNSTAVRESMVMMREAANGNFTRMAGSASIMANALGLMPAILSPVGLAIGAVAGATIGMIFAFEKGRAEVAQMDNAMGVTSNYAGMTRGSMNELASSVSNAGNLTIGASKDIVTQLVSSGQIAASSIKGIAGIAEEFARATGKNAAEITPELVKMFSDPAKGAEELNKSMHFLTVAETEHIATLERQGEVGKAQLILSEALRKHLSDNTSEIDIQGGVLNSVGKLWSKFWDAAQGIGRTSTLDEQLAAAKNTLERAQTGGLGVDEVIIAQNQLSAIEKQISAQKRLADAKTKAAADNQHEAARQDEVNKGKTHQIAVIQDAITLLENGKQTNEVLAREKELHEQISNLKKPKAVKVDHITTSYNGLMKEFSNLAIEATGKTEDLTRAQIKLNEAKASAEWKSYTPKQKKAATAASVTADEKEKTELANKQANAAQEESKKIITSVKAVSDTQIADLQFKNILIGKNTLEVQQLTEAHKIDLALQKELLAIDNNPKFAKRNKGDGKDFNTQVNDSYNSSVDETKKAADAAKAGSEVEIKARYDASHSWDVQGTAAIHTYMDNVNNAGLQSSQIFSQTFKNAENTLAKFYQTGKLGATDFVNMISGELARLAAQKTMSGLGSLFSGVGGSGGMSGLASVASMFGFANGGIMTSGGPMPLNAYANGGIANSPQLALFGEGRSPEAFVPLPDGRSIPVSLTGMSGSASNTPSGGININIIMSPTGGASSTQTTGATSPGTSAFVQLANQIGNVVRDVMIQEKRPGGILA